MKKYLMTGVAALALGTFLTSCSHDSNYEFESSTTSAQDQNAKYQAGFLKALGGVTISPTQDWGFGTDAKTRYANADANMWGPSEETGRSNQPYEVPAPLTTSQKDKVRRWFQQHPNPDGVAVEYSNFFVQQVYKGYTNLEGADAACKEVYKAQNGDVIIGSNHMDKLTAGTIEDHINNFNASDYSNGNINKDVWNGTLDPSKGSDFNDQKVYYSDQIMLMQNSSTNCFGYHTSQSNEQFNNRYVIIPGDVIQSWDPSGDSVAGMYFVGFDYDATGGNPNQALVTEGEGARDYYYSDWIVRITEGKLKEKEKTVYRIMCEDLGDTDDFDFNDVVFDVWFEGSVGHVTLQNLGGVLPISVGGVEVHEQVGLSKNAATGLFPLIGSGFDKSKASFDVSASRPADITITVNGTITTVNGQSVFQNFAGATVWELQAQTGQAPQKICVSQDTQWPGERVSIMTNNFKDYVAGKRKDF